MIVIRIKIFEVLKSIWLFDNPDFLNSGPDQFKKVSGSGTRTKDKKP